MPHDQRTVRTETATTDTPKRSRRKRLKLRVSLDWQSSIASSSSDAPSAGSTARTRGGLTRRLTQLVRRSCTSSAIRAVVNLAACGAILLSSTGAPAPDGDDPNAVPPHTTTRLASGVQWSGGVPIPDPARRDAAPPPYTTDTRPVRMS